MFLESPLCSRHYNDNVTHAVLMCGYGAVEPQRRELSAMKWFREGIPGDLISELRVQHGCSERQEDLIGARAALPVVMSQAQLSQWVLE